MAFVLRRPFAVSAAFKQMPKSPSGTRYFHHNGSFKRTTNKASQFPHSSFAGARQTFQQAFKRSYGNSTYGPQTGALSQKLLYGAAIVGGTVVATNMVFNRETREDGGMPVFERSYLNDTFLHTGLGIGIIGLAARTLHHSGWSYRLMAANPWVVIGLSLVGSIGTMYGTFNTSPDK